MPPPPLHRPPIAGGRKMKKKVSRPSYAVTLEEKVGEVVEVGGLRGTPAAATFLGLPFDVLTSATLPEGWEERRQKV